MEPPDDLRTEHRREPMGIDAARPRFTWRCPSGRRGARPTAFRLVVTGPAGETAWDSGIVESDLPRADYGGPPLPSDAPRRWRVSWRDETGAWSGFSEPASFSTGLLAPADRAASWITMPDPERYSARGTVILGVDRGDYLAPLGIYLRKEFDLPGPVARATAYACGPGYFELTVNGTKAGDAVLEPSQTDFARIGLLTAFDVTGLLRARNALGVLLGNGRHVAPFGHGDPRLWLDLEVVRPSGERTRVVSDGTWRASHGPVRENGLYHGERYDARLGMPGWDRPGFDDSSWRPVGIVDGPPLAARSAPPVRAHGDFPAVRIDRPAPGTAVFDFGANRSGWVRLGVEGPAGTTVRLRYAELLHPDGTINTATNERARSTDEYVLRGGGREEWEPRLTSHGFRYVEATGLPGEADLRTLRARFVHTDVEATGSFDCDHQIVGRIHDAVVRSYLGNLVGLPTDCPQRDERHGWLGDVHLAAETGLLNFDAAAFYIRYLRDIRLAQRGDGALPDVVPPYWRHLYPADPAWGSAYPILVRLVHAFTGDERVVEEHYDGVRAWVEFLRAQADGGIQRKLGKYGDWCPPASIASKKTPVELVATWCYAHDVRILADLAGILGRSEDEAAYRGQFGEIAAAFNAAFLSGGEYATFRNGPVDREPSQTSNLLPLALGIVPADRRESVVAALLRSVVVYHDSHLDTGILGTRHLFDVLTDAGHGDLAFRILAQPTYPGPGYMVSEGATTLWERWEKLAGGGMNSHNHVMLGSPDAWLYRAVAGLSPLAPGWRRIGVAPLVPAGLGRAAARIRTPFGPAGSAWTAGAGRFALDVRVPAGAEAEVRLPLPAADAVVEESGIRIHPGGDRRGEVRVGKIEDGRLRLDVGSGDWRFLALSEKT